MIGNRWLGYGFALLMFCLAFALRWAAGDAMSGLPFVTFFLAVLIVSAVAGTGPAVLCMVVSLVAAWFFFLLPSHSFALIWPQVPIAILFFFSVAGTQIALVHWLRRTSDRLASQQKEMALQAERHRLLYQELQHRVANGIQAVAHTLSAQASLTPEAQDALDEAAQRLLGVGEVHRRLHDPDLGDRMGEMLDGMLRQLLVSAGKTDVAVTVDVAVPPLTPETASLIGLLVAETASNSIKYAFANRFGGSFQVSLRPRDERLARLAIEDDGPGFQADRRGGESLGLTLMRSFAERLRGELRLGEASTGGALVSLDFPLDGAR